MADPDPVAAPPTLRRPKLMVAASCGCVAVIIGLTAGALIVLPAIGEDLQASQTDLQWISDSYPLVIAALLLPAGALLDRYGRRRGMLVGLVILVVSLAATAVSGTVDVLIASRCAAAVGAALVFPGTLATITAVLPVEQRRTGIAIWSFSLVLGAIAGMLLCAAVTELWTWQGSFVVLAVVVALLFVLTAVATPETRAAEGVSLDPVGSVTSAVGVGGLTFAITEGPVHGWASTGTIAGAVVGVVLLAVFVRWELGRREPLLDVRLLADREFGTSAAALLLMFFAHFALVFLAFQYESYVLHYDTLKAALGIVPPCVGFLLTPLSPVLARRLGRRRTIVGGLVLMAAGAAVAAAMGTADHPTYWTFAVAATVMWCGMGLAMAPPTESIVIRVPAEKQGVASAVNDLSRELGAAFGIAIAGSAFNTAYRHVVDANAGAFPRGAVDAVRSAPVVALRVLEGGPSGAPAVAVVQDAVMRGWSWGFGVVAVAVGLSALVVALRHPASVRTEDAEGAGVLAAR